MNKLIKTQTRCPECRNHSVEYAKIDFYRASDRSRDWRLYVICPACGAVDDPETLLKVRAHYDDAWEKRHEARTAGCLARALNVKPSALDRVLEAAKRKIRRKAATC